jgi:hypothetical protein
MSLGTTLVLESPICDLYGFEPLIGCRKGTVFTNIRLVKFEKSIPQFMETRKKFSVQNV